MKSFGCIKAALGIFAVSVTTALAAPIALTGESYVETFDGISGGLPAGWDVRVGASVTAIGTLSTFASAPESNWSSTAGGFKNFPSPDGGADRTLGVRQTGSFGDPGASFSFNIANTDGFDLEGLTVKAQVVGNQPRTTTYTLQYGLGTSPSSWTTLTTIATDGDKNATLSASATQLEPLNDLTGQVWLRVAALTASTGSGNRDSFGIDDFTLSYSAVVVPEPTAVAAFALFGGLVRRGARRHA